MNCCIVTTVDCALYQLFGGWWYLSTWFACLKLSQCLCVVPFGDRSLWKKDPSPKDKSNSNSNSNQTGDRGDDNTLSEWSGKPPIVPQDESLDDEAALGESFTAAWDVSHNLDQVRFGHRGLHRQTYHHRWARNCDQALLLGQRRALFRGELYIPSEI